MTTQAELVQRVSALAPLFAANAETAERERKPVDAVMEAVNASDAYRYFVPKKYGGHEFGLDGFMQIGMALGAGCLSTAWVTTFCMEHNWLLSLFDQPAQDDLFGSVPYIVAPGALSPNGVAAPVDGGYSLSGRWQWGTGVMHADWVLLGALVPDTASAQPQMSMLAVPVGDIRIVDTWRVAGMAGTGSNDIEATEVFVPAHRAVDLALLRDGRSPGAALHNSPLYRLPMLPFLALTAAAPAIGAALRAVDLFKERLAERLVYGAGGKQLDKPLAQARLGHATAQAEMARGSLLRLAGEVSAWGSRAEPSKPISIEERARVRLQVSHAVHQARDLVNTIVEASGASAQFLDSPLQRIQRDLNTLSCHTVFDQDTGGELYGRLLLGLTPNAPI